MLERAQPKVKENQYENDLQILAFDIETSKAALRFPDATVDPIIMISYMIDGMGMYSTTRVTAGYLLVNRELVGADVDNFDFTPMPEYAGPFTVINLKTEADMLREFFLHIRVSLDSA